MPKNIKISIIIPTKNGEKTIATCLNGIFKQKLISETEVIIIDSGSTDKTLEIVNDYPVRLYKIKPEEFGHGKTRNYGASLAKGEFLQMTVQDARPASNDWLEIMLSNLVDNEVVAVSGRQAVPHEIDKNPLEWYRPISKAKPYTLQFKKGEFEKLSPAKQRQNCGWDDVNAMYRKSYFMKNPFDEVEFGEDMRWAKKTLIAGKKIAYDMRSVVWHYHHYKNLQKLKERINYELKFKYEFFGLIPKNSYNFKYFIRIFYLCIKYKVQPKWWIYNLQINLTLRMATAKFITHTKQMTLNRFAP